MSCNLIGKLTVGSSCVASNLLVVHFAIYETEKRQISLHGVLPLGEVQETQGLINSLFRFLPCSFDARK